jgi:hypothetical protein
MSVLAVSSVGLGHAEEGAKWMKRSREATPLICMHPEFSKALELIRNGWDGIPELVDPLTKSLSPTVAATALTQQISALFKLHRIEEAEVALARLAKFPNTEAIIFMYKTKLLGEQGKVDDEIVLLKECINKRYAMSLHRAQLLRSLHKIERKDEENSLVKEIVSDAPDSPSGLMILSMAMQDTGHISESQTLLSMGRSRFPNAQLFRFAGAAFTMMDLGSSSVNDNLKGITGPLWFPALMLRFIIYVTKKLAPWMNRKKPGFGDRLTGPMGRGDGSHADRRADD